MLTPEVYSPVQRRQMDLGDYVDVARRHRPWVLGPLFASAVIACVVAFVIPNTYVSSAMLRISAAQMSQTVMPTVLSQEIADRINSMEQDILSRASLAELVQRPALDLYKSERARQGHQNPARFRLWRKANPKDRRRHVRHFFRLPGTQ
jgi:uncharacterized protein involved in exopolysaccharide biosynthesis